MKKIGITTNSYRSSLGFSSSGLSNYYHEKVTNQEALPILIPIIKGDNKEHFAKTYAESLDALILTGGTDISPMFYHEAINPKCGMFNIARDEWELALIKAFHIRKKPILGICRGMQLINVYFGGSLLQDIPKDTYNKHWHNIDEPSQEAHKITSDGTRIGAKLCSECWVNSFHHQCIDKIGPNFSNQLEVGYSEDHIVELLFDPANNIFATQWHPEMMFNDQIFTFFMELDQPLSEEYQI